MADLHAVAIQAARRAGIDPNVFVRQINQESGFNPNARSGAGAVGIAQIVPRYHPGVNPLDPVASLNYAANWMGQLVRQYGGSYEKALSVYNSGKPDAYQNPGFAGGQTYNYVRNILGGRTPAPAGLPSPSPSLPVPAPAGAPAVPPPRGLSSALAQAVNTGNQMFGLPPLPAQLLSPVAPQAAPTLVPPAARTLPIPAGPGGGQGALRGFAVLAPGADRQGVAIQPAVLNFVGRIGQLAGHPLTIGTGTNHNQYVQGTHRESDHWTGYAADIPASGAALTRLGQTALVAAGADPAWARKQTGGLYNIGGKQVIFNSMEGGNHYNHLHVGIRTR